MLTKLPSPRLLCVVLALVVVAACGGGSESDGPQVSDTSSAAPATPTATASAVETRPVDDQSDAGAVAFSEFVVGQIFAVATGADVDDLLTLATDDCTGCINLAQSMQKNKTVQQQLDGPPVVKDAKVINASDDGNQLVVSQVVEVPAGRKVDTATGAVTETLAASQLNFVVKMDWSSAKWTLTDYSAKALSR